MSEPIITFNNRTLRVEHDGWYLEVKVLTSGRQLCIRARGNVPGSHTLVILPSEVDEIFVSSNASQKEAETLNAEPERPDNKVPPATRRASRTQG